jgi:hypothetical protein
MRSRERGGADKGFSRTGRTGQTGPRPLAPLARARSGPGPPAAVGNQLEFQGPRVGPVTLSRWLIPRRLSTPAHRAQQDQPVRAVADVVHVRPELLRPVQGIAAAHLRKPGDAWSNPGAAPAAHRCSGPGSPAATVVGDFASSPSPCGLPGEPGRRRWDTVIQVVLGQAGASGPRGRK